MKTLIQLTIAGILLFFLIEELNSAPLPDYTFKSPSFNGSGYSSHVLTIMLHNKAQAAMPLP
jgi:hypothetical protein